MSDEKRPFHAVTKGEARMFANAFFGRTATLVGRDDEADKDSNGYLFTMGRITLDVFPFYGKGTEHEVLTAELCVNGLRVGFVESVLGEIRFLLKKEESSAPGQINIFYQDENETKLYSGEMVFLLIASGNEHFLHVQGKKGFSGSDDVQTAFYYSILSEISKTTESNEHFKFINKLYLNGVLPQNAEDFNDEDGGMNDD